MPGVITTPLRGRQIPKYGLIWNPSAERVKSGFGRKCAVISFARDSAILAIAAFRVGFASSNFSLTCCQLRLVWARRFEMSTPVTNRKRNINFMKNLMRRIFQPHTLFLTSLKENQRKCSEGREMIEIGRARYAMRRATIGGARPNELRGNHRVSAGVSARAITKKLTMNARKSGAAVLPCSGSSR